MQCPHCRVHFEVEPREQGLGVDATGIWSCQSVKCPACDRLAITLVQVSLPGKSSVGNGVNTVQKYLVWPKGTSRAPCPPEVPKELAADYQEACLVLTDSPQSSAALSRRCLQYILRETAKVKPSNLKNEIDEVLESGSLPSHIAEALDAVRNIGNFAAHPTKSRATGEIVPVENGEAEWTLDVLEALFDFYFVQPALRAKKKQALNEKLKSAGKSPMP